MLINTDFIPDLPKRKPKQSLDSSRQWPRTEAVPQFRDVSGLVSACYCELRLPADRFTSAEFW